ncbi:TetR/AcrR family transcriptional regulator [Tellurirhabdus bombi]|uniref:TetR/AcrR family transcriptional regulator n=1 Tax=Tellurirhabdus bombi TaxID=2907205 RepID=UPI001F2DF89A|nr:TetR/AcrR family transcriptional regulator [Tellurirhabdus bombi]
MAEEVDTESKIKEAAKKVFLAQGYEGAKIRQIAEEAGVNIALVNYYFRSKDQLFKSIYMDAFRDFLGRLAMMLEEQVPLEVKVWKIVDQYTDFLIDNPLIPIFVLSEFRRGEATFFKDIDVKGIIATSYFTKQLADEAAKGTIRSIQPLQVIFTIIGNIVFPILAKPVLSYVGTLDETGFRQFMEERKRLVPEMVMAYLRQV